ncbi:hypothetical protein YC2023_077642 [Brassica napus]
MTVDNPSQALDVGHRLSPVSDATNSTVGSRNLGDLLVRQIHQPRRGRGTQRRKTNVLGVAPNKRPPCLHVLTKSPLYVTIGTFISYIHSKKKKLQTGLRFVSQLNPRFRRFTLVTWRPKNSLNQNDAATSSSAPNRTCEQDKIMKGSNEKAMMASAKAKACSAPAHASTTTNRFQALSNELA